MLSYFVPIVFGVAQAMLFLLLILFLLDFVLLYTNKKGIKANRLLPDKFSNGDKNTVKLYIENHYTLKTNIEIIDEIPIQFQLRNFSIKKSIATKKTTQVSYKLKPTQRGEYHFGHLNIYATTALNIIAKRYVFNNKAMVPTYPSFKQLKKFELVNINKSNLQYGLKKVRRIGQSMEFEQIKDYVLGDDLRTINWKATAKRNQLMVNQFQDETSQSVYSIIDKGRIMQMPFNNLSLLDYAINATLVISNVVLKKNDKAGMLSFSKKIDNLVVAQRRNTQMKLILESLYNIKTDFYETNFSQLYSNVKQHITQRSLLLIYTNFETLDGLNRQINYLKGIAKNHVLVLVFFKNTTLKTLVNNKAETTRDVYDKVIAEKFEFEKRLIVNELKKQGIHTILTTPKDLTINTINTYLKIKSRGLI